MQMARHHLRSAESVIFHTELSGQGFSLLQAGQQLFHNPVGKLLVVQYLN